MNPRSPRNPAKQREKRAPIEKSKIRESEADPMRFLRNEPQPATPMSQNENMKKIPSRFPGVKDESIVLENGMRSLAPTQSKKARVRGKTSRVERI